ncbi:uncharacterized protein BDR25DRAFT_241847, partial [Lindgomyces ingoldianus]
MSPVKVNDTGFTEIYRPKDKDPTVDFVLVHGLQGHPYRTWATEGPVPEPDSKVPGKTRKRHLSRFIPQSLRPKSKRTSMPTHSSEEGQGDSTESQFFWPEQLLPAQCPEARILVWGYDTRIVRYGKAVNKNHLYSYGKDFLYDLCRHRTTLSRPIIFLAHSLGGIIVKEALAISSESQDDPSTLNVVESTAAVVFMGTPHRGSEDWAATGEKGRKIASALLMDSTSSVLDSLGLENADLERCHDKFTRLWEKYKFRVKTFQEGRPLYGVKIGPLNKKVVPNPSSLIGNLKERAETLDADHREMCRFKGLDDNNYQKVGPELKIIYDAVQPKPDSQHNWDPPDLQASLSFSEMELWQQTIDKPVDGTCQWIVQSSEFQSWLQGQDGPEQPGLLWIKGKPGSGKSTLMKETLRLVKQHPNLNPQVASFFFSPSGANLLERTSLERTPLERMPLGLFRSLIYQLLPGFHEQCLDLTETYQHRSLQQREVKWDLVELQEVFQRMFSKARSSRTVILIDGVDECEVTAARDLVRFFRRVTVVAHTSGAELRICFSSRNSFTVTNPLNPAKPLCREIVVEDNNSPDITLYTTQTLKLGNPNENSSEIAAWTSLEKAVVEKASGVFLWVVLVINLLQNDWDDGRDIRYLWYRLTQVPSRLEQLYVKLMGTVKPSEVETLVHTMQWVLLSARPLELAEWHHVMAFIANPSLSSLKEWEGSKDYTQSDEQIAKRIKKICLGLVEIKDRQSPAPIEGPISVLSSLRAGAGSFESGKYVHVIHESVREFFLNGRGFALLDPAIQNPRGDGNLYILGTCISYGFLEEMDIFRVKAR